ncbi:MAG: type III pantothenate kinase [Bacteroidota bacterium]
MTENLVIDIGNTRTKWAVYEAIKPLKFSSVLHRETFEKISEIIQTNSNIEYSIISASGKIDSKLIELLQNKTKLIILDSQTKIPFQNNYNTPKTLGKDRIALMAAARLHYPSQNVLVVDLGTCITYDVITEENIYQGGAISPGIEMRLKALHKFTENLPLQNPNYNFTEKIGKSTQESINIGVVEGVAKEIEGFYKEYLAAFQDLTLILTGGDAEFLAKQLKNSIFADLKFHLDGLNSIIEFNKS